MNLADLLAPLTQFALCLVLTLTLPRLMQRLRLPGPIGFFDMIFNEQIELSDLLLELVYQTDFIASLRDVL